MKRTVRNIVILGLIFAVLGVGFWWLSGYEPSGDSNQPAKTPELLTVYDVEKDSISAVNVVLGGDMVIRYEQLDNGWTVGELPIEELSQEKLESFISAVSFITSSGKIDDTVETCGLDTPSVTITIEKKDGTEDKIKVGDKSAVLGGYFLSVNGGDIYNVPEYKIDTFKNGIEYYQSFTRVKFNPEEITEIKLEREKNTLHIWAKTESDGTMTAWEIASPFNNVYNANDTYISDNILRPIGNIDISTPVQKGTDTGLGKPKGVVTVKTSQGETVLKVGNTDGDKIYVEYEGSAYVTDADSFAFLNADEFLAVSKLLALTNIATLNSLTVLYDSEEYLFEVAHTAMGENNDEMTFKLNGEDLPEKEAKALYQKIIGIPSESRYNGEPLGDIVAELNFTSVGAEKVITFSKLNDMYASYTVNGVTEFTVRLSTLENVLSTLIKDK